MATSDVEFLAEVEDFLVSCDLAELPLIRSVDGNDSTDELSIKPAAKRMDVTASRSTQKSSRTGVNTAKREMEKAKDRKRRNAYRERQRIERESLKLQVEQLTAELKELRSAKTDLLTALTWEMIAQRQLRARLNAESLQRRMCAEIDGRAALIEKFQRYVNRRCLGSGDLGDLKEAFCRHKKARVHRSEARLYKALVAEAHFYEQYIQGLEAAYAHVDEILRGYGLESTEANVLMDRWTEDGETGDFLYVEKRMRSLGFQPTCEVLWCTATLPHRQTERRVFKELDDTAAYKFRVTTSLQSGKVASVVQRVVTRRYQEYGRMILIWRSFMEGEGMFTGMHADEIGMNVATPLETAGTLIRTCIRHTPMHFSRLAPHEPVAKYFTDSVLDSVSEDGAEIAARLEKLLL